MAFRNGLNLSFFGALAALLVAAPAVADPIRHPTAVFAGLDKITGRIINFEVAVDETVQFRTLQVTPRVCNTRPQTEAPQTTSFVEVDEQMPKPDQQRDASGRTTPASAADAKGEVKRIFSGWMFAASPGLHGVEHPVYDVWLVDCKGGKEVAAAPAATPAAPRSTGRAARQVEPAAPAAIEAQPIGPADEPTFNANAPSADAPAAAPAGMRRLRSSRCAGVSFTKLKPPRPTSVATSASISPVSGSITTALPASSGEKRPVTVRSNAVDEWTGAPPPPPAPNARVHHDR